jgi:hypothetical protein
MGFCAIFYGHGRQVFWARTPWRFAGAGNMPGTDMTDETDENRNDLK